MTITDIVANIDQRLADLDAELAHLNGAKVALTDIAVGAAAKVPPRRARRTRTQPAYEVVPAGKIIELLSRSEGMSTRELSQDTNADPAQVLALLKEQENASQVRRTGTRAATRWHAITDEDQIAARAAELTATSRRGRARNG